MKGAVNIDKIVELVLTNSSAADFAKTINLVPAKVFEAWSEDLNAQVMPFIMGMSRTDYLEAIFAHSPELADKIILPNLAKVFSGLSPDKMLSFMMDKLPNSSLNQAIGIITLEYPKGIPPKLKPIIEKAHDRIAKDLSAQKAREEKEILDQIEKGELPKILDLYIQNSDLNGINRIFDTICKESNNKELTTKFLNAPGLTEEQRALAVQNGLPYIVKNNKMNIFEALLDSSTDIFKQLALANQASALIKEQSAIEKAMSSKESIQNFGNVSVEDQIVGIENKVVDELKKLARPSNATLDQRDVVNLLNEGLQEHIKNTKNIDRTQGVDETKDALLSKLLDARATLLDLQATDNQKFTDAFKKLPPSQQEKFANMMMVVLMNTTQVNTEDVIRLLDNVPKAISDQVLKQNISTIVTLQNKELTQNLLARDTNFAELYLQSQNTQTENNEITTLVNLVDQLNKQNFNAINEADLTDAGMLVVGRIFTTKFVKANDLESIDNLLGQLTPSIVGIIAGDNVDLMIGQDNAPLFQVFYDNLDRSQEKFFLNTVSALSEPGSKIKDLVLDIRLEKQLQSHIGRGEWKEYLNLVNNPVHPQEIRDRYSVVNTLSLETLSSNDMESIIKTLEADDKQEQYIKGAFDKLINETRLNKIQLQTFLVFTKPGSDLEKHITDICRNDPILKDNTEIKSVLTDRVQAKIRHHKNELTDEAIEKEFGKEISTLLDKMFERYKDAKEQASKNNTEPKDEFITKVLTEDLNLKPDSHTYKQMTQKVGTLFDTMVEDRKDRGTLEKILDAIKNAFKFTSLSEQFQEHVGTKAENIVKEAFKDKVARERTEAEGKAVERS